MKNTLIKNYIEKNYKDLFKENFKYNKDLNAWISPNMIYLYCDNHIVYEDIQNRLYASDYIEYYTTNYNKALKQFKNDLIEWNTQE